MAGARHPYLDWPHPIAFAHRGGTETAAENTMSAFAHAVELGYRYVETDVHATADGVLVAFHDPSLDRVTDRTGRIAELPWSEVRRARIAGEGIPLLEDLLARWPDLRVNIDAKSEQAVVPLAETIVRLRAQDRVCVASFSSRRVAAVRRLVGRGLCTALGTFDVARLRLASVTPSPRGRGASGSDASPGRRRTPSVHHCAQVPLSSRGVHIVDPAFVAAAHARGIAVHVWTIDDPAEMARLLDLGVDGIMTDRPSTLKETLLARAQWAS